MAINHDADAIGMHKVNHSQTRHYLPDIREVGPLEGTRGELVGLLHASPGCSHHSQALGKQPRSKEIRSRTWVVHRWAGTARPDVITLENVEQMPAATTCRSSGPSRPTRRGQSPGCSATGRRPTASTGCIPGQSI